MRGAAWGLGIGLVLATPLAAQETPYQPAFAPEAGAGVCPGGLCQPHALSAFFRGLRATEAGERAAPVHIVQIGDSHTAGDRITGAVRARLQARFGNAGRGVLPPGAPYAGYAPYQVQVQPTNWSLSLAPLTPASGVSTAGVGLAGGLRPLYGPEPRLDLVLDPGSEARIVSLCGEGGRDGAVFQLNADGDAQRIDLSTGQPGPACRRVRLDRAATRLSLTPQTPGAALYDIALETGRPGVMVSNLGVVGASLRDLAARDEAIVGLELGVWRPSLVILAFGTNEGFDPGFDPLAYDIALRGQIARLRRLAPQASILILGAPDALRGGQTGGCSADGTRAPPPSLALVRNVQRQVAEATRVAFWDWQGRMGGDCSADRLATQADPFVRPDRVHFTSAGADWIGGVLSEDLMAAYDAWKGQG
jgi:lysophospholipase L1-like esterase